MRKSGLDNIYSYQFLTNGLTKYPPVLSKWLFGISEEPIRFKTEGEELKVNLTVV